MSSTCNTSNWTKLTRISSTVGEAMNCDQETEVCPSELYQCVAHCPMCHQGLGYAAFWDGNLLHDPPQQSLRLKWNVFGCWVRSICGGLLEFVAVTVRNYLDLFGMSGKTCVANPINIISFSSMRRAILVPGTSTTSSNYGACDKCGRASGECLASRFCCLCAVARGQRMGFAF